MRMWLGLSLSCAVIAGAAWSARADTAPVVSGASVVWERAKDLLPEFPTLKAWEPVPQAAPWDGRRGHGSAVLGGKLWIYGGNHDDSQPEDTYFNDVWSTQNGSAWTRAIEHATWSPRQSIGAASYDGKLWVLGGFDGTLALNDVYSSPDGINWTQVTASAQWPARTSFATVVHNDLMWVIGGVIAGGGVATYFNDVWYSANGKDWNRATANADWAKRYLLEAAAFKNELWVLGGFDGATSYHDVWSSENGNTWTEATATAPWGGRSFHSVVVYEGKLWLTGGSPGADEVWYSEDGASWFEGEMPAWDGRLAHTSQAFGGKIYLLGGRDTDGNYTKEIWTYESGSGMGCGAGSPRQRTGAPFADLLPLLVVLLVLMFAARFRSERAVPHEARVDDWVRTRSRSWAVLLGMCGMSAAAWTAVAEANTPANGEYQRRL